MASQSVSYVSGNGFTSSQTFFHSGITDSLNCDDGYLERIRKIGIFKNDPPEAINNFTAEELVGAKLWVFENGNLLITKQGEIMACSPEMAFKRAYGKIHGIFLYWHIEKGNLDDCPCEDSLQLQTELQNQSFIPALLPYLNGIPKYKG